MYSLNRTRYCNLWAKSHQNNTSENATSWDNGLRKKSHIFPTLSNNLCSVISKQEKVNSSIIYYLHLINRDRGIIVHKEKKLQTENNYKLIIVHKEKKY